MVCLLVILLGCNVEKINKKSRIYYWDAGVFTAYFMGEREHQEGIIEILTEIEQGECKIITSESYFILQQKNEHLLKSNADFNPCKPFMQADNGSTYFIN